MRFSSNLNLLLAGAAPLASLVPSAHAAYIGIGVRGLHGFRAAAANDAATASTDNGAPIRANEFHLTPTGKHKNRSVASNGHSVYLPEEKVNQPQLATALLGNVVAPFVAAFFVVLFHLCSVPSAHTHQILENDDPNCAGDSFHCNLDACDSIALFMSQLASQSGNAMQATVSLTTDKDSSSFCPADNIWMWCEAAGGVRYQHHGIVLCAKGSHLKIAEFTAPDSGTFALPGSVASGLPHWHGVRVTTVDNVMEWKKEIHVDRDVDEDNGDGGCLVQDGILSYLSNCRPTEQREEE